MIDIAKRLRIVATANMEQGKLLSELALEGVSEIERLQEVLELAEEAAHLLLRTGEIKQEYRDRALTMLDRARAGGSVCETNPDDSG